LFGEGYGFPPGLSFGADFPTGLSGKEIFQAAADDVVVVDHQDFQVVYPRSKNRM